MQLLDDISWEKAKQELIDRLGDGTIEKEAWKALEQLEHGYKDIVDLGAEAAKLAKKVYPEQEETTNLQFVEAFVRMLDLKLALEVQKLCHHASCGTRRDISLLPVLSGLKCLSLCNSKRVE